MLLNGWCYRVLKCRKARASWSMWSVHTWRVLHRKVVPHIGIAADSTQSGAASLCHVLPSEKCHITQWEALFSTPWYNLARWVVEYLTGIAYTTVYHIRLFILVQLSLFYKKGDLSYLASISRGWILPTRFRVTRQYIYTSSLSEETKQRRWFITLWPPMDSMLSSEK
jgi:hypothetical protein